MKRMSFEKHLQRAVFERNCLLIVVIVLAFVLMLLSMFLFMKKERIVITPPTVEKAFWVEGNHVSPTYLEQFGVFLADQLLTKSIHSISTKNNVVLKHVTTQFSPILRKKLIEEEALLKKQNASYVFFPHAVSVDPTTHLVRIDGERTTYINGKALTKQRECYQLTLLASGGRLLLNDLQIVGERS